jgi:hypothetical protein
MSSSQPSASVPAPERQHQSDAALRRALPVSLSAALDGLPAMRSGPYVARVLREMVQPMLRLSSIAKTDVTEPVCVLTVRETYTCLVFLHRVDAWSLCHSFPTTGG